MSKEKFCVCEVEQLFDEEFDGTLCKAKKVLQIFDTEQEAEDALLIFDPMQFDDYVTVLRVVSSDELKHPFR